MSGRHEIRESRKAVWFGTLAGWLMRCWARCTRMEVEARWRPEDHPGPVIFALWHNRIFTAPAGFRRAFGPARRVVVLTSASGDGAMVARAMAVFGFGAVRGSSSRRGAAALVGLAKALRDGADACITPDGPRGPRYVFHPGVVKLAEAAGVPIVPVHVSYSAAWRLKTWDRFVVPKPFSRVRVVFGEPLWVARAADEAGFEAERQRVEAVLLGGVDDR